MCNNNDRYEDLDGEGDCVLGCHREGRGFEYHRGVVDNFSRVIFSIFFVRLNVGLLYKGNSEMVEKY